MKDKLFQMIEEDPHQVRARTILPPRSFERLSEDEATEAAGGRKCTGGLNVHMGALTPAVHTLIEGMFKPRPQPHKVNYGNCVAGYNLEYVGEDDEYIFTRCSGRNHALILAKKTQKHEQPGGGFGQTKDISDIVSGNKYAR